MMLSTVKQSCIDKVEHSNQSTVSVLIGPCCVRVMHDDNNLIHKHYTIILGTDKVVVNGYVSDCCLDHGRRYNLLSRTEKFHLYMELKF